MKIDIEGHEKAALEGAADALENHLIGDIIYEDHACYPSEVSGFLENYG